MAFRSLLPHSLSSRRGRELEPFSSFQSEMNRLFQDMAQVMRHPEHIESQGILSPEIDIKHDDKNIIITCELPGVDEKDVDVELADGVLSIRGEKKFEKEKKDENFYLMERSYGSFQRSINLPTEVDENKVDATFEKGVLTITLPKTEEAKKQSKKIQVKAS